MNATAGWDLINRVNWIVGATLSYAQKLVLVVLAQHDGEKGIYPSIATIAREAGLSVATVKRALKELEAMALIRRTHRYEVGSREATSTLYQLTLPLSQVGSAGANVSSHRANPGSDGTDRLAHTEPGVGSHRATNRLHEQTNEEQSSSASVDSGDPTPQKQRGKRPAPEGYQEVVDRYFALFELARRTKPNFGGPQVAAMIRFVRAHGRDKAIAILEKVYAPGNGWATRATINQVAADSDKYTSPSVTSGGSRNVPRQPASAEPAWTVPVEVRS